MKLQGSGIALPSIDRGNQFPAGLMDLFLCSLLMIQLQCKKHAVLDSIYNQRLLNLTEHINQAANGYCLVPTILITNRFLNVQRSWIILFVDGETI